MPPVIKVFYHFFRYCERWINDPQHTNIDELTDYFCKNYSIVSNGHTLANSAEEYKERMHAFQHKYAKCTISEPLKEPFISGNKVSFYYHCDFEDHAGEKTRTYIMGIGTVDEGKILHWEQVAHEGPLEESLPGKEQLFE